MKKHECSKRFCETCKTEQTSRTSLLYATVEERVAPIDRILLVFYDFETTQITRYSDTATVHVPKLVCIQNLFAM